MKNKFTGLLVCAAVSLIAIGRAQNTMSSCNAGLEEYTNGELATGEHVAVTCNPTTCTVTYGSCRDITGIDPAPPNPLHRCTESPGSGQRCVPGPGSGTAHVLNGQAACVNQSGQCHGQCVNWDTQTHDEPISWNDDSLEAC